MRLTNAVLNIAIPENVSSFEIRFVDQEEVLATVDWNSSSSAETMSVSLVKKDPVNTETSEGNKKRNGCSEPEREPSTKKSKKVGERSLNKGSSSKRVNGSKVPPNTSSMEDATKKKPTESSSSLVRAKHIQSLPSVAPSNVSANKREEKLKQLIQDAEEHFTTMKELFDVILENSKGFDMLQFVGHAVKTEHFEQLNTASEMNSTVYSNLPYLALYERVLTLEKEKQYKDCKDFFMKNKIPLSKYKTFLNKANCGKVLAAFPQFLFSQNINYSIMCSSHFLMFAKEQLAVTHPNWEQENFIATLSKMVNQKKSNRSDCTSNQECDEGLLAQR